MARNVGSAVDSIDARFHAGELQHVVAMTPCCFSQKNTLPGSHRLRTAGFDPERPFCLEWVRAYFRFCLSE